MNLILRELTFADEESFLEGLKAWEGEKPYWYSFIWAPGMTYERMMNILDKERRGVDLAPGRVPHTMLYGFLGNEIIGRVSVRHSLNENLLKRGGNIGYAVAPKFRRQGYATELTRQALTYCRSLGLDKILVTCADSNAPSWKIIEHFQGQLENKVWDDEDNEMIRRYWINL